MDANEGQNGPETAGKTDLLDQRIPAPIEPGKAQRDKRFELSRVVLEAGIPHTLTYRVQPDTYLIIHQGEQGEDLIVCYGPFVAFDYVELAAGQHVRIAGVDPRITLASDSGTVAVVIAEAGYPAIGFGV